MVTEGGTDVERPKMIEYNGATRYVCATLPHLADLGTIVGPRYTTGEYLTVVGHWEGLSLLSYMATTDGYAADGAPRSVAEHRLMTRRRARRAVTR